MHCILEGAIVTQNSLRVDYKFILSENQNNTRLSAPFIGQMFTRIQVTEKHSQVFTRESQLCSENGIAIGG